MDISLNALSLENELTFIETAFELQLLPQTGLTAENIDRFKQSLQNNPNISRLACSFGELTSEETQMLVIALNQALETKKLDSLTIFNHIGVSLLKDYLPLLIAQLQAGLLALKLQGQSYPKAGFPRALLTALELENLASCFESSFDSHLELKELELSVDVFSRKAVSSLRKILQKTPNLEIINLQGKSSYVKSSFATKPVSGFIELLVILTGLSKIKVINLSHCNLGDEVLEPLVKALENLVHLKVLNLSYNSLGEKCAFLLDAMAKKLSLNELYLEGNSIPQVMHAKLTDFLNQALELTHIGFSFREPISLPNHLAQALIDHPKLQHIRCQTSYRKELIPGLLKVVSQNHRILEVSPFGDELNPLIPTQKTSLVKQLERNRVANKLIQRLSIMQVFYKRQPEISGEVALVPLAKFPKPVIHKMMQWLGMKIPNMNEQACIASIFVPSSRAVLYK